MNRRKVLRLKIGADMGGQKYPAQQEHQSGSNE
jgi:hypothetical protein